MGIPRRYIVGVALIAIAIMVIPIISSVYSQMPNINIYIRDVENGVEIDIDASYRGSAPGDTESKMSLNAYTTYIGSRYTGSARLSIDMVNPYSCYGGNFSMDIVASGSGGDYRANANMTTYNFNPAKARVEGIKLYLSSHSVIDEKYNALSTYSGYIEIPAGMIPREQLSIFSILTPDMMNMQLMSQGINWVSFKDIRISVESRDDVDVIRFNVSTAVDQIAMALYMNITNIDLVKKYTDMYRAIQLNNIIQLRAEGTSLGDKCYTKMVSNINFDYNGLTIDFAKINAKLITEIISNLVLSKEGREALGFLQELVPIPSNMSISFEGSIGKGVADVSLSAKGIRIIHSTLTGYEATKRVAQIIKSILEPVKMLLPMNIVTTIDVAPDPAITSNIYRAATLAYSGSLFTPTLSILISPLTAIGGIGVVTEIYTPTPTYYTTTIPTQLQQYTTLTTTVTQTMTKTVTEIITIPTTVLQTITQTVTSIATTTTVSISTTTIEGISITSIAIGAIIAIIGIALGFILRRK